MQEATGRKLGLDTWNCDLWADGTCSHPPATFFLAAELSEAGGTRSLLNNGTQERRGCVPLSAP